MLIYATDHFVLPLPPGHRFPMAKYARLRERVAAIAPDRMREPPAATDEELERAHDRAYVEAVANGTLDERAMRRIGFPWSPAMVERSRHSAGATIAACRSALAHGFGVNLAGGTHHAHRSFGEGFCVFNDAAVAARAMQVERLAARVLIVDLDVHQGDGTAAIVGDDPTIHTLSIHGRNTFPFRKQASRQDVELDDGTGDWRRFALASRSTLPAPIRMSATGWDGLRSARPGWRHGMRTSSIRCARPTCRWRSQWPAATRRTSRTSSTSTTPR